MALGWFLAKYTKAHSFYNAGIQSSNDPCHSHGLRQIVRRCLESIPLPLII